MAEPIKPVRSKSALTVKIVWFLLGVFFLITLISQIHMMFYVPLKTEVALYYETTQDLRFKGVYIRGERQIAYDNTGGVVAYTNKDGSKIATNSVIAKIYSSKKDIFTEQRIAELQSQIKSLSDAKTFAGTDNTQLDAFLGQLADKHLQILNAIDDGDYEKAAKCKSDYLSLQSKINVVKGIAADYSEKIAYLEAEIDRLAASVVPPGDLTISESGYFVSVADGYEDSLKYDGAFELTKEQIESIIRNPQLDVPPNIVGKVIDDYKWRMAAIFPIDKTHGIFEGKKADLIIGASQSPIQATVKYLNDLKDGTVLCVFECDLMIDEFVRKRVTAARLLLDDYKGIRISQAAVRFNEAGECGVFVLDGSAVKFKKIELIHTENDYVIAENTDKAGYLKLYDRVIVGGKDLYDGKIIS